jgi:hypothetical protein
MRTSKGFEVLSVTFDNLVIRTPLQKKNSEHVAQREIRRDNTHPKLYGTLTVILDLTATMMLHVHVSDVYGNNHVYVRMVRFDAVTTVSNPSPFSPTSHSSPPQFLFGFPAFCLMSLTCGLSYSGESFDSIHHLPVALTVAAQG